MCSHSLMNDSSEMTITKHVMSGWMCRFFYIETELSTSWVRGHRGLRGRQWCTKDIPAWHHWHDGGLLPAPGRAHRCQHRWRSGPCPRHRRHWAAHKSRLLRRSNRCRHRDARHQIVVDQTRWRLVAEAWPCLIRRSWSRTGRADTPPRHCPSCPTC